MKKKIININQLAGLEYHGHAGITQLCLKAIARIIHYGEEIEKANLLSNFDNNGGDHSFILENVYGDFIVIKSGFASGYGGEGPKGLSTALKLLRNLGVEIEEYEINSEFQSRLDKSCLLSTDLDWLEKQRPIRPIRYYDYIDDKDYSPVESNLSEPRINQLFPPAINFGLIDSRLMDLGRLFFENPDHAINTAFRRLEDTVRKRINETDKSGEKLFKKAFEGQNSILHWNDVNVAEHAGKVNLFKAIFAAYRNPRAHREIDNDESEALREFMLINELFILEANAVERKSVSDA